MKLNYIYVESTVKPSVVKLGKTTAYIRKDIRQAVREDDGETVELWTYQEAKMPRSEFDEYSKLLAATNAMKNDNVPTDIANLILAQENGDNNQLIIMEALADLYEMIAAMNVQEG